MPSLDQRIHRAWLRLKQARKDGDGQACRAELDELNALLEQRYSLQQSIAQAHGETLMRKRLAHALAWLARKLDPQAAPTCVVNNITYTYTCTAHSAAEYGSEAARAFTEGIGEAIAEDPRIAEMVASGEAASKGAARRKLGIDTEPADTDGPTWHDRIRTGLAGTRPALPNIGPSPKRSVRSRVMDWLELTDYGYGFGLLAALCGCVALFYQLWWLAAPLLIVAFALCWWFG